MQITVFCDGASRGQGVQGKKCGEAAAAAVVFKNNKEIIRFARGIGQRTNNEAEYEAVLLGLTLCMASGLSNPIIYSDSLLITNHIQGSWRCEAPSLVPYYHTIKTLEDAFPFDICYVKRKDVKVADKLVNTYLDSFSKFCNLQASRKDHIND